MLLIINRTELENERIVIRSRTVAHGLSLRRLTVDKKVKSPGMTFRSTTSCVTHVTNTQIKTQNSYVVHLHLAPQKRFQKQNPFEVRGSRDVRFTFTSTTLRDQKAPPLFLFRPRWKQKNLFLNIVPFIRFDNHFYSS